MVVIYHQRQKYEIQAVFVRKCLFLYTPLMQLKRRVEYTLLRTAVLLMYFYFYLSSIFLKLIHPTQYYVNYNF